MATEEKKVFDLSLKRRPANLSNRDPSETPDSPTRTIFRSAALQSCGCCYRNLFLARRNTIRQKHVPAAFCLVHLQNHAGGGWGKVCRTLHQKKVRAHLRH